MNFGQKIQFAQIVKVFKIKAKVFAIQLSQPPRPESSTIFLLFSVRLETMFVLNITSL